MATTNELLAARTFLRRCFPRGGRVLCAVSGGMDSMCLLYFLDTWGRKNGFDIAAAHFNHQLRGTAADRDQAFVETWCQERKIPCFTGSGDTRALMRENGLSMEEAARTLRYAFLQETAGREGYEAIMTAHHADDNAETMLLNLIRGTGTAGLTGIPRIRGNLYRPFLRISRSALAEYARCHAIPHVEDETNGEDFAARNVLRHQVFPVLRQLNARAVENMSFTAGVLERENAALEELAEDLMDRAVNVGQRVSVSCTVLMEAPLAVAERMVLQLLCAAAGARKDWTSAHVEAVLDLAEPERRDGEISLPYGLTARREGYTLYVERSCAPPAPVSLALGESVPFGAWRVSLTRQRAGNGCIGLRLPAGASLQVTTWLPSDRLNLPGSRGSRSVKRLCAERGIPPGKRDVLPVLRVDGVPAAIAQLGADTAFAASGYEADGFVAFDQTETKKIEENEYEK